MSEIFPVEQREIDQRARDRQIDQLESDLESSRGRTAQFETCLHDAEGALRDIVDAVKSDGRDLTPCQIAQVTVERLAVLEALLATANEKARYCTDETAQALVDLDASREREAALAVANDALWRRFSDLEAGLEAETRHGHLQQVALIQREKRITQLEAELIEERLTSADEASVRDEHFAEIKRLEVENARCREIAEHDGKNYSDAIAALRETREALEFVIGDHHVPGDCYSTGPVTGTSLDAICPSCRGLSVLARYMDLMEKREGETNGRK